MIEGKLHRLLGVAILVVMAAGAAQVRAAPAASPGRQELAPTYRVLATREGLVGRRTANNHVIKSRDHFVSLPSWSVLSPKDTSQFAVRLTYNGRTVIAPVWDVGP
jgi:hypothetical protein